MPGLDGLAGGGGVGDAVLVLGVDPEVVVGVDHQVPHPGVAQVWSLTQFYSLMTFHNEGSVGVRKCIFNKCTIKVCASCYLTASRDLRA